MYGKCTAAMTAGERNKREMVESERIQKIGKQGK